MIFAALVGMAMVATAPAFETNILRVEVSNVRGNRGRVHVDACTPAEFLKDCALFAEAPARAGTTVVTLTSLPPGRYAAQVSYDENGNGRVDRGLFGIPKEGVGFSNDAPIRMAPPKLADALFEYRGGAQTIAIRLRYFIGPDGPR